MRRPSLSFFRFLEEEFVSNFPEKKIQKIRKTLILSIRCKRCILAKKLFPPCCLSVVHFQCHSHPSKRYTLPAASLSISLCWREMQFHAFRGFTRAPSSPCFLALANRSPFRIENVNAFIAMFSLSIWKFSSSLPSFHDFQPLSRFYESEGILRRRTITSSPGCISRDSHFRHAWTRLKSMENPIIRITAAYERGEIADFQSRHFAFAAKLQYNAPPMRKAEFITGRLHA